MASRLTEQLPVSDVVGFVREAARVWNDASTKGIGSLFDRTWGFRPFGVSVLGYPFGFSTDFRAFYWRSLAIPSALCVAASLLAAMAGGARLRSAQAWLLAILGGALPMWWFFDDVRDRDSQWGTSSGFTAGLAALATALLLFGWKRGKAAPIFASFLVAALVPHFKAVGVSLLLGHAVLAILLFSWRLFVDRERIATRERWALGLGFLVVPPTWLLFAGARWVEDGDPNQWGVSLAELHAFERAAPLGTVLADFLWSFGVYGLGLPALALVVAASAVAWNQRHRPWWILALVAVAVVGLLVNVGLAWSGAYVQRLGAFMPGIAVFWILCCPAILWLWQRLPAARWAAMGATLVLGASVCIPPLARAIHPVTGYATFLDAKIATSNREVQEGLAALETPVVDPVIFQSRLTPYLEQEAAARQVILGPFEPGSPDDLNPAARDGRVYAPRLARTRLPHVHPHEVAHADFVLALGKDSGQFVPGGLWKAVQGVSEVLHSPEGRAAAQVIAENDFISVFRPTNRVELERLLIAKLQESELLDPAQSGPVEPVNAPGLATFASGDVLVDAEAQWNRSELRVRTTWSGTRSERSKLYYRIGLVDESDKAFYWFPTVTMLPPPAGADGETYRRTIVDKGWRRGFVTRAKSVVIQLVSADARKLVSVESKDKVPGTGFVRIPLVAPTEAE